MAGQIAINPQRVREVAGKFKQSSEQSQQMVQQMRTSVDSLQGEWKGVANQSFFAEYQNWTQQMGKYVSLLDGISRELNQIATEFERVDQSMARRGT